jgi:nucleoside-diphosphate-sugar epimerase
MAIRRKAVVTGAAGFIGRGVCERLVADGYEVTGLDLSPNTASTVEAVGASYSVCDTTDPDAVDSAVAGADAVVHAAAIVSDHGTMSEFIRVNVHGTRNVLDSTRRHGVGSVVHISSVASWGYDFRRPPTDSDWTRRQGVPYVDTKAASDDLALRRGAAVVRPGDVYGPRSTPWSIRPLESLKAGTFRLPGRGEGLMTPVFGDDLVDLVIRALGTPAAAGRAFTGFSGQAVTAATFFDYYARMLGMNRTPTAPRPLAVAGALAVELTARLSGRPPAISRTAMTFIERKAGYSTTLAQDLLGWSQTVDLDEGMRRTEQWFRETGMLPTAAAE